MGPILHVQVQPMDSIDVTHRDMEDRYSEENSLRSGHEEIEVRTAVVIL